MRLLCGFVVLVALAALSAEAARVTAGDLHASGTPMHIETVDMAHDYPAPKEIHGFQLKEAYKFDKETSTFKRHVRDLSTVTVRDERCCKTGLFTTVNGSLSDPWTWTKAERVRAYIAMQEETNPPGFLLPYNGDPNGPPHDEAWRKALRASIQADQTQLGISPRDIFAGDKGDGDLGEIGVHALIYVLGDMTVISYQGSYSDMDYNQDGIWWKQFIYNELPSKSRTEWVKWGQAEADITAPGPNSNFVRYYQRAAMDYVFASAKPKITAAMVKMGFSEAESNREGYYALAKYIGETAIAQNNNPNTKFVIIGHSLGGALAMLTSMYFRTKSVVHTYETVAFAGIGVDCLSKANFPDIDTSIDHNQIVNYLDPFDIFTLLDTSPGTVCYWQWTSDTIAMCKPAFGYGTELFVSAQQKIDFGLCRRYTHSLYHEIASANDTSILNDDGTTFKCEKIPMPDVCVQDKMFAGYVTVLFFTVLLLISLLCCMPICCICWRGCCCIKAHPCPWLSCCSTLCPNKCAAGDNFDIEMDKM